MLRRAFLLIVGFSLALGRGTAPAESGPPRGINTWSAFRYWVDEAQVLESAAAMADLGMVGLGWKYLVVDEGWFVPWSNAYGDPMDVSTDGHGRYLPDPIRFPSGFRSLCGILAAEGILCGVHVIMGVPIRSVALEEPIPGTAYTAKDIADVGNTAGVPPMNYWVDPSNPVSQAYYDAVVLGMASWGVRFIKFDFASSSWDTMAMRLAIDAAEACGYPSIVLSVNGNGAEWADMYRVTDDVWDVWTDVEQEFGTMQTYAPKQREGNWADLDLLTLGRIGGLRNVYTAYTYPCTLWEINCQNSDSPSFRYRECCPRQAQLSLEESRTMMTMHSIARSPLMFGGYIPQTPREILALLLNEEVLRVNSEGQDVMLLESTPDRCVWVSHGPNGETWLAAFNLLESPETIALPGPFEARDLWERKDLGCIAGLLVEPHGCRLLEIRDCTHPAQSSGAHRLRPIAA